MRTARRASANAQWMLGELINKLPYEGVEFPFEFGIVVYQGEAIHLTQQICMAIKQHNAEEYRRKDERWEEQIAQAKKPGGIVTLPDYELNIIPWILKYRLIDPQRDPTNANQDENYRPRCELYADFPKGRAARPSKMGELIMRLFPQKLPEIKPKEDPFERYMRQGISQSPEAGTGIDKGVGES
jgi:hypothetical protein